VLPDDEEEEETPNVVLLVVDDPVNARGITGTRLRGLITPLLFDDDEEEEVFAFLPPLKS
jgi:hypothetical protein